MKRLAELKTKNKPTRNQISTPEPNFTRSTSPKSTISQVIELIELINIYSVKLF
jgi:hypothetical protein